MNKNFYIISYSNYDTYEPIYLISDLSTKEVLADIKKYLNNSILETFKNICNDKFYTRIYLHDIIRLTIKYLESSNKYELLNATKINFTDDGFNMYEGNITISENFNEYDHGYEDKNNNFIKMIDFIDHKLYNIIQGYDTRSQEYQYLYFNEATSDPGHILAIELSDIEKDLEKFVLKSIIQIENIIEKINNMDKNNEPF